VALVILMVALHSFAQPILEWALRRLHRLPPRLLSAGSRLSLEQHLRAFVDGTRGLRHSSVLGACIAYSAIEWLLIAFCYAAVFNSFSGGLRLGFGGILIFMGAVMAGSMVNLPGVGGGIQVASILVLTEWFSLAPELAASISLLIWAFTFLAVIPPALLLMVHEGLSWGKLRRLESEN
jgi:uncharacterized membrane protein YbhN (UPF0104 family)